MRRAAAVAQIAGGRKVLWWHAALLFRSFQVMTRQLLRTRRWRIGWVADRGVVEVAGALVLMTDVDPARCRRAAPPSFCAPAPPRWLRIARCVVQKRSRSVLLLILMRG